MRTCVFFFTLLSAIIFSSPSAMAFSMMNSTGIDMQSASLMNQCQKAADLAALRFEKVHDISQCPTGDVRILENTSKLTGLALDKKGFVYEMFVGSSCSRSVKLEVTVGPSQDGQRCLLLSEPTVLGTVSN